MIFDIFILSPWMCLCWCQALRTQEAAHAEAEEREDLEIAAEVAGIELNHVRKFLKWCFSPWLCNSLKKKIIYMICTSTMVDKFVTVWYFLK